MVAASKPVAVTLLQQMGGRDCRHVVHPWTTSCWKSSLHVVAVTLFGMSRLMLPAYAAQVAMGGWRPELASALCSMLRSMCFGSSVCGGIVGYHCLFRYLLGGYKTSTVLFWPTFLAGFSLYIEDDRRKSIIFFYYFMWVLEWLYRRLSTAWPAASTHATLTLLFMAANAALMWTLRRDAHPRDTPVFWFFKPSRCSDDTETSMKCPHQGTCWNHGFTLMAKYSAVGVALQAARSLVFQWGGKGRRGLGVMLARAFSGNHSLGLFLGAYVALYQAVRCGLCRLRGEDRSAHALLAGLASGAAFWLHPDLTVAAAAVASLMQLWVAHRCDRRLLVPASSLCLSVLVYAVLIDRLHCPSGFIVMADIVAPGIIPGLHKRFFYLE